MITSYVVVGSFRKVYFVGLDVALAFAQREHALCVVAVMNHRTYGATVWLPE